MKIQNIKRLLKDKDLVHPFLLLAALSTNNEIKYSKANIAEALGINIKDLEKIIIKLIAVNFIQEVITEYTNTIVVNPNIINNGIVDSNLYTLFNYYKPNKDMCGVYLMEDFNYYKIGKSNDINKRLEQHKQSNPLMRLVSVISCSNASQVEAKILGMFKHLNVAGEFFLKEDIIKQYFYDNE